MPVPDAYRRYGRDETSYTSSYTRGQVRSSSYLSSYSTSKQTSLPPRPLYTSKYGDSLPTSTVSSRFLPSSSSRIRDYGGTTGSYRQSITDRLKAMDIDGKDDDLRTPTTYTSRYVTPSRSYTSAYSRDRSNSREYGVSPLAATSTFSYRERDSSLTRSSTESLKKRSSPSPTKATSRKDSSPSPAVPVTNGVGTSASSEVTISSSSSTSESATCSSKGVSSLIATCTSTIKNPLVTTNSSATTVSDNTTDNSDVIVGSNNTVEVVGGDDVDAVDATTVIVSESSRAYKCVRDFENNDLNNTDHGPPSDTNSSPSHNDDTVINTASPKEEIATNSNKNSTKSPSGMVKMNNGNSSDDGGGSQKDSNNSVVVMVVQDRNNKKVKSAPSSSALKDSVIGVGAGATSSATVIVEALGTEQNNLLGSSASSLSASPPPLSSASDAVFSTTTASVVKIMEKDSNGNPISVDIKDVVDSGQECGVGSVRLGKSEESGATTTKTRSTQATPSTTKQLSASGVTRRRRESDSNANNLVESPPTVARGGEKSDENGTISGEERKKINAQLNREPSPHESFTIRQRKSSGMSSRTTVSPAPAAGRSNSPSAGSSPRSSTSRVIYHTIKVEDGKKSQSPEPVNFTVTGTSIGSSASATGEKKPATSSLKASSSSPSSKTCDASVEFNVSLPRRRSSTVKPTELPSSTSAVNEISHSNGNIEAMNISEDTSSKSKLRSNVRHTISPPKSGIASNNSRTQRKSGSPGEKVAANHRKPTKHEEDSSSSVEDDHSEQDKPSLKQRQTSASRSATPSRSVGTSAGSSSAGREFKSKSKSPAPKELSNSETSTAGGNHNLVGASKYCSEGPDNVNGFDRGPHSSKFSSSSQHLGESSNNLGSNKNDRKSRYPHLTGASSAVASDSSDNDSDAFSSSPQIGGRFRTKEGHERAGLTGLRNIGNTCFMNTVLQCLSNTKPLIEYVIRDNYVQDINSSTSAMKGSLIRAFSEVIQELWREQRVVDTSAFKDQIQKFAPRFMGYSQQDAQEFLRYLLEGLHEEVNRVTAKPTPILTDIEDSLSDSQKAAEAWKRYLRYEDSRIVDIFVGQLRSTLKCTVCGNCSVTFDPFWDLSLPIPARTASTRLAQCFELFTKEEVLDGDEKPTCSKCQCRRKCTKSFSIQKFPRILVIHLKRFSPTERYRGKLSTLVDCPINSLDVAPFAANRGQTLTYNLYGVANHSGSTYSGHYIAYCKHPYSGEWHSYNDSRVSPISTHQVISTEGYVLFYEQSGQSS